MYTIARAAIDKRSEQHVPLQPTLRFDWAEGLRARPTDLELQATHGGAACTGSLDWTDVIAQRKQHQASRVGVASSAAGDAVRAKSVMKLFFSWSKLAKVSTMILASEKGGKASLTVVGSLDRRAALVVAARCPNLEPPRANK